MAARERRRFGDTRQYGQKPAWSSARAQGRVPGRALALPLGWERRRRRSACWDRVLRDRDQLVDGDNAAQGGYCAGIPCADGATAGPSLPSLARIPGPPPVASRYLFEPTDKGPRACRLKRGSRPGRSRSLRRSGADVRVLVTRVRYSDCYSLAVLMGTFRRFRGRLAVALSWPDRRPTND